MFVTINSDIKGASSNVSILISGSVVDCCGPWWEHTRFMRERFNSNDKRVIRGRGKSPAGNIGGVQIDQRWAVGKYWSFIICKEKKWVEIFPRIMNTYFLHVNSLIIIIPIKNCFFEILLIKIMKNILVNKTKAVQCHL